MATAGVNDGDMLQLLPQQQQQGGQQQQQPGQDSNPMAFNDDGSSKNPAALMAALRGDPRQLSAIEESNPPLAKYAINMRIGILHATTCSYCYLQGHPRGRCLGLAGQLASHAQVRTALICVDAIPEVYILLMPLCLFDYIGRGLRGMTSSDA